MPIKLTKSIVNAFLDSLLPYAKLYINQPYFLKNPASGTEAINAAKMPAAGKAGHTPPVPNNQEKTKAKDGINIKLAEKSSTAANFLPTD